MLKLTHREEARNISLPLIIPLFQTQHFQAEAKTNCMQSMPAGQLNHRTAESERNMFK